jgi:hypothetical protein
MLSLFISELHAINQSNRIGLRICEGPHQSANQLSRFARQHDLKIGVGLAAKLLRVQHLGNSVAAIATKQPSSSSYSQYQWNWPEKV